MAQMKIVFYVSIKHIVRFILDYILTSKTIFVVTFMKSMVMHREKRVNQALSSYDTVKIVCRIEKLHFFSVGPIGIFMSN